MTNNIVVHTKVQIIIKTLEGYDAPEAEEVSEESAE